MALESARTASGHPPLSKRRNITNPSDIRNHYTRLPIVNPKRPRCKCNYCANLFGCHHKHNEISRLKKHLNSCIIYKRKNSQTDIKQAFLRHDVRTTKLI